MLVSPNSTIKLYSGVPLDNSYENTLYFGSLSDQNSYFHSGRAKYSFQNNTYQRVNKNRLRINASIGGLYDCNYIAFQNRDFGDKWFYGFITAVEYVNNVTSEVEYEIDVMQTYLFDITMNWCFVEREHTASDAIGSNIEPEPISVGEYTYQNYKKIVDNSGRTLFEDCCICILMADTDGNSTLIDGVLTGGKITCVQNNEAGVNHINTLLALYAENPDNIIAMYMCPKHLVNLSDTYKVLTNYTSQIFNVKVDKVTSDFDGYTPRNKKLYTYPYCYLKIDNNNGQSLCLRYEFFKDQQPVVNIEGSVLMPVQIVLRPEYYKGSGESSLSSESITLNSFPQCSWNIDSYNAWLAQNSIPIAINGVVAGANIGTNIGIGLATGNANAVMSGMNSGIQTVGNLLIQNYQASIKADECRGNISSANVNVAKQKQTFYTMEAKVNKRDAMVIDDFFTRYGYAVNKVKKIEFKNRPHYTYIKTNSATAVGKCPADDTKKFCRILDKGITFWVNASEVGRYDLNNTVDY